MTSIGTTWSRPLVATAIAAVGVVLFVDLPKAPERVIATAYKTLISFTTSNRVLFDRGTFAAPKVVLGTVPWVPKTALGRKLAAKRAAAIASGMALMSMDEINADLRLARRSAF